MSEIRRSPVEPDEVAQIRREMEAAKAHGCAPWFMGSEHEILLDHIDALTAERDALRAALAKLYAFFPNPRTPFRLDGFDPLPDNSPSSEEAGQ